MNDRIKGTQIIWMIEIRIKGTLLLTLRLYFLCAVKVLWLNVPLIFHWFNVFSGHHNKLFFSQADYCVTCTLFLHFILMSAKYLWHHRQNTRISVLCIVTYEMHVDSNHFCHQILFLSQWTFDDALQSSWQEKKKKNQSIRKGVVCQVLPKSTFSSYWLAMFR